MVLNTGPLDWESSALTTRPLDLQFLRYRVWQTEIGNYVTFFALLPSPLKTQKIRILKKWKKLLEISSFYTSVSKTTIIWGTVPEIHSETDRFFCHFWSFFAILPSNNWETKIFKKWKEHLEISSFYKGVPKITIIWCMLPEIWNKTDIIFYHFGQLLFLFTPLLTPETKNWNKCKKTWRYYPITHVYHKSHTYG